MEWHNTLAGWLTASDAQLDPNLGLGSDPGLGNNPSLMGMGFIAGKNDPCIFYNPTTGVRLAVVVDDILVRGPPVATTEFYRRLARRFDVKDPTYLTQDTPITYTGLHITLFDKAGDTYISIDQ